MNDLPEIDPSVFDTDPDHVQTSKNAAMRVAKIWRANCGNASFSIVTMMETALRIQELHDALYLMAPDKRFGFGGLNQNLLTRWFKAQSGREIPGAGTSESKLILRQISPRTWQYVKEIRDEVI